MAGRTSKPPAEHLVAGGVLADVSQPTYVISALAAA